MCPSLNEVITRFSNIGTIYGTALTIYVIKKPHTSGFPQLHYKYLDLSDILDRENTQKFSTSWDDTFPRSPKIVLLSPTKKTLSYRVRENCMVLSRSE